MKWPWGKKAAAEKHLREQVAARLEATADWFDQPGHEWGRYSFAQSGRSDGKTWTRSCVMGAMYQVSGAETLPGGGGFVGGQMHPVDQDEVFQVASIELRRCIEPGWRPHEDLSRESQASTAQTGIFAWNDGLEQQGKANVQQMLRGCARRLRGQS